MQTSTVLIFFILLVVLSHFFRRGRGRLPLPPGPPKLPLVGNLFDIPKRHNGKVFHEWAEIYGSDILHLDVAGQSIVILDSYESAVEIMDKKSAVTSGRPFLTMLNELIGLAEWGISTMPYGEAWRSHRRLFHQTLHEGASRVFRPQQQKNAINLLGRLLSSPNDFSNHFKFLAGSTILFIAYGIDIKQNDDPILRSAIAFNEACLPAFVPGRYLVDFFPFLKYIPRWCPGASFQHDALRARKCAHEMLTLPFKATKSMMANGTSEPSFVSLALGGSEKPSNQADFDTIVSNVAGVMFQAGTDTSEALLTTAIYAILLYPEVLKMAQEEIDRVVAPGHLPTFEDEASLPYTNAILLEAMRWNPIAPIGAAHMTDEETVYQGYRLPKNSILIGNAWGILHDEDIFPNPEKFDPERFIKNGVLDVGVLDPRNVSFGFGRRICPGRHLALSTVWIALASIIAVFDILPATEYPMPQVAEFDEEGVIRHPLPFNCHFKPRSAKAAELILTANLDVN